jgi:hypothetical protein
MELAAQHHIKRRIYQARYVFYVCYTSILSIVALCMVLLYSILKLSNRTLPCVFVHAVRLYSAAFLLLLSLASCHSIDTREKILTAVTPFGEQLSAGIDFYSSRTVFDGTHSISCSLGCRNFCNFVFVLILRRKTPGRARMWTVDVQLRC